MLDSEVRYQYCWLLSLYWYGEPLATGRLVVEALKFEEPGGGGSGPDGGGAGRIGRTVVEFRAGLSLGLVGRPGLKPSTSRGRAVGGPEVLDFRGGNCRSELAIWEGYKLDPLLSVRVVRCAAGCSADNRGLVLSSTIGMSPEVGLLDAVEVDDSLDGEDAVSPRSNALVDGES